MNGKCDIILFAALMKANRKTTSKEKLQKCSKKN